MTTNRTEEDAPGATEHSALSVDAALADGSLDVIGFFDLVRIIDPDIPDDAVDLGGAPVMEGCHEAQFGQRLGQEASRLLDCLGLHVRLVDHAVVLHGEGHSEVEAGPRAEPIVGEAVPLELMAVEEPAVLAAAERAWV